MRGAIAFVLTIAVLSCCCPQKTLLLRSVKTSCAKPQPERKAETISKKIPVNCPDGLACYTDEDDAKLARALLALENLERWARITRTACKSEEP